MSDDSSRARRWQPRRFLAAVAIVFCLGSRATFAQSIHTVAGGGLRDNVPATLASLQPVDVAADSFGNLYIADWFNDRIRRVDGSTGVITTVAGNGKSAFGGDGRPATKASLRAPLGVAFDEAGNLYIADAGNFRIRRVDVATGIIVTVAGNGQSGFSGDGGPATEAALNTPYGVALDRAGNLYIADWSRRIRRVDGSTGVITTVAGNGQLGFSGDGGPATEAALYNLNAVAVDGTGNLYIADWANDRIRRVDGSTGIITTFAGNGKRGFSGDGGPATEAALNRPVDVALDEAGNLYIAEEWNHRIRRVDRSTGIITTVAGSAERGFSGDGGPATEAALNVPSGVGFDATGNLYVADRYNLRVRRVDVATRFITTVAGDGQSSFSGDGGPATEAALNAPSDVAFDAAGNLYIADHHNSRIRRVDGATGIITTAAGNGEPVYDGFGGDGGPATEAALDPEDVGIDGEGNLFIVDGTNYRIRRVDASTGIITTVAGSGEPVFGSETFGGDGGPATEAALDPVGIAVDETSNLFIADSSHQRVRRVDASTGIITTVAGSGETVFSDETFSGDGGPATEAALHRPVDVALDGAGNLYIVDGLYRIRRVDGSTGIITTVAGNGESGFSGDGVPATETALYPEGVTLDGAGNLYIADLLRIRRVDGSTGIITTIAGNGQLAFHGDGGQATEAALYTAGVALDGAGNLYIADSLHNRIRAVYACIAMRMPVLESPSNGASGLSLSPSLSWNLVEGAFRYDVYLDRASPPQRIVASDIETTSLSLSGLEPLTTYYWKIVAKGDPFCEPFRTAESEVWSFTTSSSCEVPEPAVP